MAGDVLERISEISNILGLGALVGIIAFLILCWRRIYYVYHLRDARREARRRIRDIQDEILSLRDSVPNIDRAISQALHTIILDRERCLGILSPIEDSLWFSFSAFFRADPCLRLLEGLELDLRQKVQRMTEVRENRRIILNTCQTNAALPTTDMSSPRTCEAQPSSSMGMPGLVNYIAHKHKQDTGLTSLPNLPSKSSGKPPTDSWHGPLYSPMPAPSEYTHSYQDSHVHLPVSNGAQLISNEYELTEIPRYRQSHAFSSGSRTTLEPIGTNTGDLRHRGTTGPALPRHPGSNINARFRNSSFSSFSRGRPLTRPRAMVERVLDPVRVRPHISTHADVTQYPTSGGISSTPTHLEVPLFDWVYGGSDASGYSPDSPSTPSNLSRTSSASSMHRRPRSRSHSGMPYTKPSSNVTAGVETSSPERPKSDKKSKYNGRDEFPGQGLHIDEKFLETVLGDNPSLRALLDNILSSPWRTDHIVEPNYRATNDNVSQGLDLPIELGSSVLLAFILKSGDEFTCVLCNEVLSARAPRQLGHVRGHIDLRPFPCEGCDSCDPKYPARFFSRDLLQDHHRSSKSGKCPYCDEKMRRHNLKRHIQTKHPQLVGGGAPRVKIATTQWEANPFLPPPALEPYGVTGHSTKMLSSSKDIAEYLSQANS